MPSNLSSEKIQKRTKRKWLYCTEEEAEMIKQAALDSSLDESSFIRTTVFKAIASSKKKPKKRRS